MSGPDESEIWPQRSRAESRIFQQLRFPNGASNGRDGSKVRTPQRASSAIWRTTVQDGCNAKRTLELVDSVRGAAGGTTGGQRFLERRAALTSLGLRVGLLLLLPTSLLFTQCSVDRPPFPYRPQATGGSGGAGSGGKPGAQAGSPSVGVDDACQEEGLRTCVGSGQKQRFVCSNGAYERDTDCSDSENCDALSGACVAIVRECAGKSAGFRFCDAQGKIQVCGADLVRTETEECSGTCRDGQCKPMGCGDGVVSAPEECDDGNFVDTDGCTSQCKAARCGDSVQQPGEDCDDGNNIDTDSCVKCKLARCGDGVVGPNEQCDDGNTVDADACSNTCKLSKCGDGVLHVGEDCDDGNAVDNDTCTNACKRPKCGDKIVQSGEACDDGNTVDNDTCSNRCTVPGCGDSVTQTATEECDDGNTVNTDSCTVACKKPKCGDSFIQTGEECDDGNTVDTDGCTNACKKAKCGDGVKQAPTEDCDDGNTVDTDGCSNSCHTARCGDSITQTGEECDDGNTNNSDMCTASCKRPRCGDGILSAGESCEDGNQKDGDGCSATCQTEVCGDSKKTGIEECDDGNKNDNDGCSAMCRNEVCGDGIVQRPREECEDRNTVDTDLCRNGCKNAASLNALSSSCANTDQITQTVCMVAVANWCKQYNNNPLAGMVTGQKGDNEYAVGCTSGFTREEVTTSSLNDKCPGGRQQSPACLAEASAACQRKGYTQGFYLGAGSSADTTALACGKGAKRGPESVTGCNGIADTSPVPVDCAKALADKCGSGKGGMIQALAQATQVTYACVDLSLTGSARLKAP